MSSDLKERVRRFWQANPCGSKFTDAPLGSRRFYEAIEQYRYSKEWHIPLAADFASTKGLKVLEIGCGLGIDGVQFARAGADYTGVDLTDAAVELTQKNFDLLGLPGTFRTADAENLDFANDSFDLVFSHGVLHHTPDIAQAIKEIHRVLRPGGRAVVMLYHRDSYNYRINISILRRAGVHLLKWPWGIKMVHRLTREPLDSLHQHARQLKENPNGYFRIEEFLNRNTDGAGNPLTHVYSRRDARSLFQVFSEVEVRTYFFNKRWLFLLGNLVSRSLESWLAGRWGWHLWIYATK